MTVKLHVLIVQSTTQDIHLVESVLAQECVKAFDIVCAATLEDALQKLSEASFSIILLSWSVASNSETQFAIRMLSEVSGVPVLHLHSLLEEASSGSPIGLAGTAFVGKFARSAKSILARMVTTCKTAEKSLREEPLEPTVDVLSRLRASEERYALAIEGARDGIWDWNLLEDSVYYSQQWLDMLGLTACEMSDTPQEWLDRVHPEDVERLRRSLEDHLKHRCAYFRCEYRIRHADGHYFWVLCRGGALWNEAQKPYRIVGSQVDISCHKQLEEALVKEKEQLAWRADRDSLTGLANRQYFVDQLTTACQEQSHHNILCYLDLDHFKVVNDTCGHAAGDELLQQVSTLLNASVRQSDLLARLGGDEFGLILYNCQTERARLLAVELCKTIQKFRFLWNEKVFSIGVSIGLVAMPPAGATAPQLMRLADAACYSAKNKGRNQVEVYTKENEGLMQLSANFEWFSRITKSMEEGRFSLYSQEIKPLQPGKEVIQEILLRLSDARTHDLMPPMAFIPPAERYDLMPKLDRWTIHRCFQQLENVRTPNVLYSLNLSGATLSDDSFISFLQETTRKFRINPHRICFEISETVALSNIAQFATTISTLKDLGFRFALDNFGSGMSSFVHLKRLPVDYLKIDGSLVSEVDRDEIALATLKSINEISHIMGLVTVAEHIANKEILNTVRELNIDYAQGFEIAKPRPFNPISQSLANRARSEIELSLISQ